MHRKDDLLRAYIDQESRDLMNPADREHVSNCPECQARLDEIAARTRRVQTQLDGLAPGPREQPRSTQAAYARLAASERFNPPSRTTNLQKEIKNKMFTRRPFWTALAIIAVLGLIFTLTPASAWANGVLGLFRVQKVQVITFDPAAAENARMKLEANSETVKQLFKDDVKITQRSETAKVATAEEASTKAGFTPRLSATQDQSLEVKGGMKAVFTINQPKLQELIDTAGVDIQLPKDVNGKTVTAEIPNSVIATSGCPTADLPTDQTTKESVSSCTVFVQLPSPTVDTPAGIDMTALGEAMFQFLGVPADQAAQLSQRIDWTSTLVLPVPSGGKVQYQDVQVDGVTGTFLQEEGQNSYEMIWVKNGMLYGLHGPGSLSDAMKYVGSIK
jgi:hypothetical protein